MLLMLIKTNMNDDDDGGGVMHQVDVLTGWIHHPVYVYLSLRTIREKVVCGIVPHFIEVRFHDAFDSRASAVLSADSSLPVESIPVVYIYMCVCVESVRR